MSFAPGRASQTERGEARAWIAASCLAARCLIFIAPSSLAYAEPLPSALEPEPSHMSDEREFPPATVRAYQRAMEQGLSEFVVGRWAEARALFLRGHLLLPNARSFRVLGMTAFNLALYPAAVRELNGALRDPRRPLGGALRQQTEQLLAQAEALVGRYRMLLEPLDAELRVDGLVTKLEPDGTLLLAVGQHLLELEAPTYLPLARRILVDGHDHGVLVLRLQSRAGADALSVAGNGEGAVQAAPAAPRKPLESELKEQRSADYRASWGLGVGSFALGGASLGLFLAARDEARALEARCQGTCAPWEGVTDKRDRLERWSQGLLMTSLVFAVTSAVLALVERDRARDQARRDSKAHLEPLQEPL